MTKQPEALRLADRLQDFALALPAYGFDDRPPKDAAAELRRLHAEVEALRAAQGEQKPVGARYRRIGRHVAEIAKRLGRPDDSAEGELEYIQRLSYSQGLEDASPVATHGEQLANPAEMATWLMARRSHLGSSRGSSIAWGGEWGAINWDNYTKLAQHFAALSATPVATTKDDE